MQKKKEILKWVGIYDHQRLWIINQEQWDTK